MNRRRINRISALLLFLGLASALVISVLADRPDDSPFRSDPRAEKRYLRDLRTIGGKGNEVAAEFQDWFAAQWRGQALARTVALLTVAVTLAYRFLAFNPALPVEPAVGED